MAKHEFAIMRETPNNERYDSYEPQNYSSLISIDDDYIEILIPSFEGILCYCHTRLIEINNLVYCGITLIPPESAKLFVVVFEGNNMGQYDALIDLFKQAIKQEKYIIHYGL